MIMIKMIVKKKIYKHKNNSKMQHCCEKDEINVAKKKEEEKIPTI